MNALSGGLPVSGTHLKRRLTAILAMDVCSHSLLMTTDDMGAT